MRLKKKLTLMNPQELYDYLGRWEWYRDKRKIKSLLWKFCQQRIKRIKKEIRFKDLLFAGLKHLNSDKIGK